MIASLNPKQLYIVFPKSTKDENFPNQPQDSYICQNQAKSINQKINCRGNFLKMKQSNISQN